MWPIHGRYVCPRCLREYALNWEVEHAREWQHYLNCLVGNCERCMRFEREMRRRDRRAVNLILSTLSVWLGAAIVLTLLWRAFSA